jgi:hypothetical protein
VFAAGRSRPLLKNQHATRNSQQVGLVFHWPILLAQLVLAGGGLTFDVVGIEPWRQRRAIGSIDPHGDFATDPCDL